MIMQRKRHKGGAGRKLLQPARPCVFVPRQVALVCHNPWRDARRCGVLPSFHPSCLYADGVRAGEGGRKGKVTRGGHQLDILGNGAGADKLQRQQRTDSVPLAGSDGGGCQTPEP